MTDASGAFVPEGFVPPAGLDRLWQAFSAWVETERPFERIDQAPRP
jgi:hypothetical protein